MKNTQELVHALYVLDLIKDLRRRKIGFKSVEERAACMCRGLPGGRKRTLVSTIMNWKLKDAYEEVRKARCKNTREWREVYPIIRQERRHFVAMTTPMSLKPYDKFSSHGSNFSKCLSMVT